MLNKTEIARSFYNPGASNIVIAKLQRQPILIWIRRLTAQVKFLIKNKN